MYKLKSMLVALINDTTCINRICAHVHVLTKGFLPREELDNISKNQTLA